MADELTKRVIKIKQNYKLTQAEFADRINVQRSSVSHMVNGRNKASADLVIRILEAFPQISAEWIMRGEGEMFKKDKEEELFDTPSEVKLNTQKKTFDEKTKVETPALNFEEQTQNSKQEELENKNKESEPQNTENNKKIIPPFNVNAQGKEIVRVIIFYSDKTFVDFKPE